MAVRLLMMRGKQNRGSKSTNENFLTFLSVTRVYPVFYLKNPITFVIVAAPFFRNLIQSP